MDEVIHKNPDDIIEVATLGTFVKIDQLFQVSQFKKELNDFLEPKFKAYFENEEKTEELVRDLYASVGVL